ncbi:DUF4145 domain-containing protein [Sorangium sp. So ce291]|uniref:DUF4145 domain-containing protein n=1 Tax=Sorangium sp. So ce291 TaxID=3133294 RepID=UPI003F63EA4F
MQVQLVRDGKSSWSDETIYERIYVLGHCVKCNQTGLVEFAREYPDGEVDSRQLYPTATRPVDLELPPKVMESYTEALKCESAGAWLATAVMVRRTLEAIGKEFDPKAKRLFDGLRSMQQQGLISEELYQWGDELRFLGNIGAHPTEQLISEQDAKEALEFLGAIVETIYHLRDKFKKMQARRKRGAPGATAVPTVATRDKLEDPE